MSEQIPSGNSEATSQGGASDTTSSQSQNEEMVSKRSIESIVQKRLKTSHGRIAELEKELAQYRGEIDDEKVDSHRQSTLKAQVQQKLIEKDCIDPEVVFTDLKERGLVKLDDDDNVVVGGIYDDLDQLVDEYLSKKDYLRRSKATGGVGSKAPGINATTGDAKKALLDQMRAADTQGKRLFGK